MVIGGKNNKLGGVEALVATDDASTKWLFLNLRQ
jgi:hypothetical protein